LNQIFKLYRIKANGGIKDIPQFVNNTGYSIRVFRPHLLKTGLNNDERLKRIIWYLISMGRLRILYIMDGNDVAHYSFILPKNFRFPFMNQGDLQIGPCFTHKKYRGQGLYTTALKLIPSIFADKASTFWIYTTDNNLTSQSVIEKSGYVFQGLMRNHGFFKVLKMIVE
jgi:hypothetical protein